MKTSFRKFSLFAGILSVLFVAGGLLCAGAVKTACVVDCSRTFYFLVSEEMGADAAAEAGALGGGAGYVMEREGREYAVLSCYFSLSDAQSVQDRLSDADVAVAVRAEEGGKLYLTGFSEKKNAERLKGCFSTLGSCIRILYELSAAADEGMPQETLKDILGDVGGVLSRLAKENPDGIFSDLSACAASASEEIGRMSEGIVFAKDLRYMQVRLSDDYLRLADKFSL